MDRIGVKSSSLMIIACVFATIAGALTYWSNLVENYSPLGGSFIRVLANPVLLALVFCGSSVVGAGKQTFGIKPALAASIFLRPSSNLLAWGLFGAVTVASYFAAVKFSGAATASLLGSLSGIVTAVFAPVILGQSNPLKAWFGIGLSVGGCLLLNNAWQEASNILGWAFGVGSGVAAGFAYLSVAKLNGKLPISIIMVYWTIFSIPIHLALFTLFPPTFPSQPMTWVSLSLGGLAMAASQYFAVESFSRGDPLILGVLSYLGPVMAFTCDVVLFKHRFNGLEIFGCLLTVFGGVWTVMARNRQSFRAS